MSCAVDIETGYGARVYSNELAKLNSHCHRSSWILQISFVLTRETDVVNTEHYLEQLLHK